MLIFFLVLGIIGIVLFTIGAKNFLPKIGINSKLYLILLIISAIFAYLYVLTIMFPGYLLSILNKIYHNLSIVSDVSFYCLMFLAFSYAIFTYLYYNIITRGGCISKVHKYIITLLVMVLPLILLNNYLYAKDVFNVFGSIDEDMIKNISTLLKLLLLVYSIYLHIKFTIRFGKGDSVTKIGVGAFVWIFGGPAVFTLLTISGYKFYIPCNQELSKEDEINKESTNE